MSEKTPIDDKTLERPAEALEGDAVEKTLETTSNIEVYELPEFYLGPERDEGITRYVSEEELEEKAEKEKLSFIQNVRKKVRQLTDSIPYDAVQMAATIVSILNESVGTYVYHQLGMTPDAYMPIIESTRIAYTSIFAGNLALKTFGHGLPHLKKAEATIDGFSVAADSIMIFDLIENLEGLGVGNPRIARLLRTMPKIMRRLSAMMRTQKVGKSKHAVEDKTMEEIIERNIWEKALIFAALPLAFDMRSFDYTQLNAVLMELAFYSVITGASLHNLSGIRKSIHSNYTRRFEENERMVEELKEKFAELMPMIEDMKDEDGDELSFGTDGLLKGFVKFRRVMNPYGDRLKIKKARPVPSNVEAIVMIHDIRNFTALSEREGGEIFHLLHQCYFRFLQLLAQKFNGVAFNDTGDGSLCYFVDAIDESGEAIPKELLALKCAEQMDKFTNYFAELLKHHIKGVDLSHETGIAFTTGKFMIGDKRSAVADSEIEVRDEIKAIRKSCEEFVHFLWPDLEKKAQAESDVICMISALGNVINESARLESVGGKKYADNNGYIDDRFLAALSQLPEKWTSEVEAWKSKIQPLGTEELKGFKDPVMIHGLTRRRYTVGEVKKAIEMYEDEDIAED